MFSAQLSELTKILDSAKLDLLFYIAMVFLILFGYSIMGYLLLGHNYIAHQQLDYSFVTCYNMLLGLFDTDAIYIADNSLGIFFFYTFMILFYLLLLNIFIAIINAHFHSNMPKLDANHMGFLTKVIFVIKSKIKKKKFMD